MTLTKGESTRRHIIDQARTIYNEAGIEITLDQLTQKMGLSKSRVNNHFRTKEKLFLAIFGAYQDDLTELLKKSKEAESEQPLQSYIDTLSAIMDLQFHYRCCTPFLNLVTSTRAETEITIHTEASVAQSKMAIQMRVERYVSAGWLQPSLLTEPHWSAFLFNYINGLTQWSIFYNMYDSAISYKKVKSIYLRSIILHSYTPYLTRKGKKGFSTLTFNR
jgi:AcrR family transcriptional regulator